MYKIVEFSKVLIENFLNTLDKEIVCVDATLGNGNDALFMSKIIQEKGKVYGYDIQKQSIVNSISLFEEHNATNIEIKLKSHEFIDEENIDLCIFNLGYLPGFDKTIKTNKETTLKAINNLLPKMNKEKMLIIICLYVGHSEGLEESIEIDKYLKELPSNKYLVCKYQNYNRPTSPYILTLSYNKQK